MALIVEDGSGKSDAESYASTADVDSYAAKQPASAAITAWNALSATAKEAACRAATVYLDAVYGTRWLGYRVDDVQALDWPRSWVVNNYGFAVDADVVPRQVKDACSEMAINSAVGDVLLPDLDDPGYVTARSASVGAVSESVSYAAPSREVKEYRRVDLMLRPLLAQPGEILVG